MPATHSTQLMPPDPVLPALHLQSARALLPDAESADDGQLVQDALPAVLLYLPLAQALHAPPLGPVLPALHLQSARALLPDAELEDVGHAVHVWATMS